MADPNDTPTPEGNGKPEPTVKIGDKEFSQSQIEEWKKNYGDDAAWKRENDRRSAELKQEKREFEELQEGRQTEIDSLKEEMETLKVQLENPPTGLENLPDFSLLPPEEQAKYMRALAKEEAETLRAEIQKKEQVREQAEAKKEKKRQEEEFLHYHETLATGFREKHKEEFGGVANDAKFNEFARRTAEEFGFKNGKLPRNAFENQLKLEQDPEKLKERLKQEIRDDLTGKRASFTSKPEPAIVQPLEEGYDKKDLTQILNDDEEKGDLPDLSEI